MENTAKNFALQLGSLISLYVSIGALLSLLFGVINVLYPDAAEGFYAYESATSQTRFSIAVLIVFFPTYILLTRFVNTVRRKEQGVYLTLTKWLIYLSLLVGGAVILGDLVAVIHAFLNGELVVRFILKALAVLLVVGGAFTYYLLDARNYWQQEEKKSVVYGGVSIVLVIAAIIFGTMHIEMPSEVRELRIDSEQITDLQDMQWRVEEYYRVNEILPTDIETVYSESGIKAPTASEGRNAYEYRTTGEKSFELCADFKASSQNEMSGSSRPIEGGYIKNPYNWDHGSGTWCFNREIAEI